MQFYEFFIFLTMTSYGQEMILNQNQWPKIGYYRPFMTSHEGISVTHDEIQ